MKVIRTFCKDCPCLNVDMEDGPSCNLGFELGDGYVFKSDKTKRISYQERYSKEYDRLKYGDFIEEEHSDNCTLEVIKTAQSEFKPERIEFYEKDK